MPLFLSDEEYQRCSNDVAAVADKADAFIRDLFKQVDTIKAQADASAITAEQTCSLLEQKYLSLSSDFADLQAENSQLKSDLDQRLSELAQVQADKHQLHLQSVEKDREIERLSIDVSELHKSKRQLMELLEQKHLENSEKNASMKGYLDKIVNLTDNAASREVRLNEMEAELARTQAACSRFSEEKELIEKHNLWLNDELTSKVNSLILLRKTHAELESDMSAKLADVERQLDESSCSLKWNKEKVRELETKLSSLQEELCSSRSAAAASEEQLIGEISTVNKLVELYKESSEEWSKKASELEGVIKALEAHLAQVENDYKEKLDKEGCAKQELEKDVHDLKEKLERSEHALEASRKANEQSLFRVGTFSSDVYLPPCETNCMSDDSGTCVPNIPAGVSGTALAASLLRDGWSLAKMYGKYQETFDAFRHEQLGRKQAEAVLERVLFEIEEKAGIILDERAEHEKMVEAYSLLNDKLTNSLSEQAKLEKSVLEFKADLRKQERKCTIAQKEIHDLERQVTILLKECQNLQVRGGSAGYDFSDDQAIFPVHENVDESEADKIISERLLTFTDINGLVEQNVHLRSLVRSLSDQIENRELELMQKFELEIQKHTEDAASKVSAVLERSEEQGRMIESLHNSVAMYKRLYEEQQKHRSSGLHPAETSPGCVSVRDNKQLNLMPPEDHQGVRKVDERAAERLRCLEDDLLKSRNEITSLRLERDKLSLEANFARQRLDDFMKQSEHQREESNKILARNVEISQLIIDYQRKLRENSQSVNAADEHSRKLAMEVSVLKNEKELLLNSERRAQDEIKNLTDRVCRLQTSLDTIQAMEEFREDARSIERRKQEEHVKQVEREWADAKKELQEERDHVRSLTLDREHVMKNEMKQIEDMGKELSSALHAVATAEARAAALEVQYADLENKTQPLTTKVVAVEGEPSSALVSEAEKDLHFLREELGKLKSEAKANLDHMLQYKNIAQVNEAALKHMECAHENFKIEAVKLKNSLETEVSALRQRVSELEEESRLKSLDAASAVSGKEEALNAALAEVTSLKEERSVKMSQIAAMEIQMSVLKEDLEKEHLRWRTAQDNYERQIILQSETIQELTKTSKALASLQEEASELRKSLEAGKNKFSESKAQWEGEKSMLEKSSFEAELKYNDLNEQNKILHRRLDAWHIKSAEKDCVSAGISSGIADLDSSDDSGLQNVIKYLRRSRQIAETEISLLKQEKHRLQSQAESALKAAEAAQASLQSERANSRASLFAEDEFKSLQFQVREMNLLRESNIQLREENKYNFEECQKLREVAHKSKVDIGKLDTLVKEREAEGEAFKKEIEMQRIEKDHLENRISELVERYKNIDVQEYARMKDEVQNMKAIHESLREKDARIEELKKIISEKEDTIAQLEHDLAKNRSELIAQENKINDLLRVEGDHKSELQKQKRRAVQDMKKIDELSRGRDELSKEKQAISKQLEESKQGRRPMADATGEQSLRDKENHTRIQTLEKVLEMHRKEKTDLQKEKAIRQKNEKAIADLYRTVMQEKTKLDDEFEKHKQAVKRISDELEKLKHAKANLPEATAAVEHLSKSNLDDLFAAYGSAVENFEAAAHSIFATSGASILPAEGPVTDTSTATAGPVTSAPSISASSMDIVPVHSQTKPAEETVKKLTLPKGNSETRKPGRRLIRPRLKPEQPQIDAEMSEVDGSHTTSKPSPLPDMDATGHPSMPTRPSLRKRAALTPALELQDESASQVDGGADVSAAPSTKKSRGSDSPQNSKDEHSIALENLETAPIEESSDIPADLPLPLSNEEEAIDAEKNEAVETAGPRVDEHSTPPNLDAANEADLQTSKNCLDSEMEAAFDETAKDQLEVENLTTNMEVGHEREGELMAGNPDFGADEDSMAGGTETEEDQLDYVTTSPSPGGLDEEAAVPAAVETGEVASPNTMNEEGELLDPIEDFNRTGSETDQPPEAPSSIQDSTLAAGESSKLALQPVEDVNQEPSRQTCSDAVQQPTAEEVKKESASEEVKQESLKKASTSGVQPAAEEVKQESSKPANPSVLAEEAKQAPSSGGNSNTININERARERALSRLAGARERPIRRGSRDGAGRGRGQSSG